MARENTIQALADAANISIARLAVALEMAPHTLRRYTRQETQPSVDLADRIADYFSVSRDVVIGTQADKSRPGGNSKYIPVFGAAAAHVGFDVIDVGYVVERIERPPVVANAADAYAVFVVGTSMQPRFFAGDIAICHPGLPVREGDWVVAQLKAGHKTHAMVALFKLLDEREIVLEQINPEKVIRFSRDEVADVHRIVEVQLTS